MYLDPISTYVPPIVFVLNGELDVGFITITNVLISKSIKKG